MVGSTIVGPDICRDPDWVPSVIGYAQNVFMLAVTFKLAPDIARPLVALFTPYIYRIHSSRRAIRRLVGPTVDQKNAWAREQPQSWKSHVKHDNEITTLEWLVETSKPEEATVPMIAHRITGVAFGATHTTSNTITNAILDLANDFDRWAPPLRAEIEEVLGEIQLTEITNSHLSKMWKLDSFLKESQRFHPPSKLSVNRKMMQSHELSSGDVLPKNAHVSFAGVPMSMSDEYISGPDDFDGFRFERLRRNAETDHNGLQFTSSYAGSLHFGHGKHMCPGRFMGSLISKLLLIELLKRYDMKLQDGGRPKNIMFFDMDIPDPKYEVLFRDRQA
ncbi:hypothetical protein VN97_g5724 [Penicillium thymicola]|uniref:Uncharacterized protein n=1 Tax=Penicillium thymicola TaxID=293382 RepID=A0AAI9TIZ5_PENTH|nr:hypothetical protein VN97_g5724 [Penicillium thymicola]